jgi:hypothetical protein
MRRVLTGITLPDFELWFANAHKALNMPVPSDVAYAVGLRRRYGPTVVNNWHQGGAFSESGLRTMETGTGAALSQHKFGRAFDCKFRNVTPAEVWADLQATPNLSCFEHIQRIEAGAGMTWFLRYGRPRPLRHGYSGCFVSE